ncbi:MAG TPA: hypothetical protein VJ579_03680 [Candidatus Paceibacterota bacterium]|nr:hypothetical protein [Candidatus Paceibacterota bacterium]
MSGLHWGVGAGVILAACFGMTQDALSNMGITIQIHSYTSMIVGLGFMFVLNSALRELHALFSSVVTISCAVFFALVQHQFAGKPLIIVSIISLIVLLYVACLSAERHWH